MRLTFAGSGSAFTTGADNFQSNLVLTVPADGQPPNSGVARHLLIDCGADARFSLPAIGIARPVDIDAVYISHTHADHIGGLEWLALSCRYSAAPKRPRLIVTSVLREVLWQHSLAGGLAITEEGPATLDTYFEVTAVPAGGTFEWAGITFHVIPVMHVDGGSVRMRSYGLFFTAAGLTVYLTTDAKFDPELESRFYAQRADVIFQDCETGPRSGVHSHYSELCTLPESLRNKMWLYHYNPGPIPDARADGFRGMVARGQVFDFASPSSFDSGAGGAAPGPGSEEVQPGPT